MGAFKRNPRPQTAGGHLALPGQLWGLRCPARPWSTAAHRLGVCLSLTPSCGWGTTGQRRLEGTCPSPGLSNGHRAWLVPLKLLTRLPTDLSGNSNEGHSRAIALAQEAAPDPLA